MAGILIGGLGLVALDTQEFSGHITGPTSVNAMLLGFFLSDRRATMFWHTRLQHFSDRLRSSWAAWRVGPGGRAGGGGEPGAGGGGGGGDPGDGAESGGGGDPGAGAESGGGGDPGAGAERGGGGGGEEIAANNQISTTSSVNHQPMMELCVRDLP